MTLILEIALGIVLGYILLNCLGLALELVLIAFEKAGELVDWIWNSLEKSVAGMTRRRSAK